MRLSLSAIAAVMLIAAGPAFAQGASTEMKQAPDPAQAKAVDDAYLGRCTEKSPKELCDCVVSVANVHLGDIAERQVFFDYMMGDVDKAKSERAVFPAQKNMRFNTALQKADTMLGERCDRLRPQPTEQTAPAPRQTPTAQ